LEQSARGETSVVEMKHNALKSLWGDGPKDSYAEEKRKNTAKSMISPGERPQDIRTPKALLELVAHALGGKIALDAADTLQQTPALKHYTGEPGSDGLVEPWTDGTYCNPPYKDLKEWLSKACKEATTGSRIVVLCPVRPHRAWFRRAMREATSIVYLNPLKFEGFKQAFPAPLCLLCYNVEAGESFSAWGETA
jgi:hypothetical protein